MKNYTVYRRGQARRDPHLERYLPYLRQETFRLRGGEIALNCIQQTRIWYFEWLQSGQSVRRWHAWQAIAQCVSWLEQLEIKGHS